MTTASLPRTSPHPSPRASGPFAHRAASRSLSHTPSSPLAVSSTPRPSASRHVLAAEPAAHAASPNYFNLAVNSSKSCQSSAGGAHARTNWSPPSSRVRSAAAASPRVVPVDQNPEYAAFKRQSEIAGPNFTLSQLDGTNETVEGCSPTPLRQSTPFAAMSDALNSVEQDKPASPKRPLSSPYNNPARCIRPSPPGFTHVDTSNAPQDLHAISAEPMQISLPGSATASPQSHLTPRAETLPANFPKLALSGIPFAAPADIAAILDSENSDVLLLDLRGSNQYARSRIRGALNLCVPTTLLKRPAYNTNWLAATFDSPEQRQKFEAWPNCQYVIVYDGSSSPRKDASSCENMLKKFDTAGWKGASYIISGGFNDFSKQFPSLVQHDATSSGNHAPSAIAPVIGGCPLPSTESVAIPFFSNIRQNMDLMGGVGRMPVKRPRSLTSSQIQSLPKWLRLASDDKDDGKLVADKFLAIEEQEKKRMEEALSEQVSYGTQTDCPATSVRIAGVEKGTKNRYESIWPYEHTRVKLGADSLNSCDYVNASFVQATGTNKRYIATQCPLPATFTVSVVSPWFGSANDVQDFWNVVWQQDVRVIVMLTAETESGLLKAHNYWSMKRYGPMHLNFLSEHRASLEPAKIRRHRDKPSSSAQSHQCRGQTPRSPNVRPESGARTPGGGRTPSGSRTPGGAKTPRSDAPPSLTGDQGNQPYVTVRTFTLSRDDEPFEPLREITQLQYVGWPDLGAPEHPAHLLGLVEQCDAVVRAGQTVLSPAPPLISSRSRSSTSAGGAPTHGAAEAPAASSGPAPRGARPVLVHCSAGCGRTGTFCTVDSVVDMLKRQRTEQLQPQLPPPTPRSPEMKRDTVFSRSLSPGAGEEVDLVERAVRDFRAQRLSMVQNLRQFVLCYESLLEWLAVQPPRST
jgi:protein tyrosine phosphatase